MDRTDGKMVTTYASNNSLKIHKVANDRTAGRNSSTIVVGYFNEATSSGRDSSKTSKDIDDLIDLVNNLFFF